MIRVRARIVAFAALPVMACSAAAPRPAPVDTRNDSCAHCRMTVSDARFAAQIVAPGEEALFFDDIGCLRSVLERGGVPKDATAYVADYRTKAWVVAARAIYVRNDQVSTPMGSHLVAFADMASRDADPAGGGQLLSVADVFGAPGPPAKDLAR